MSKPLGHRNLAIRGGIAFIHSFLTFILIAFDIGVSHALPTAICQLWSAVTLFVQWWTANPLMFVARALASFVRCALVLHVVGCGGGWEAEKCRTGAWFDRRLWPIRATQSAGAVALFLNGLSLMMQFMLPKRGVGVRGNEQLFYRGFVRFCGLPIHFVMGMLKLGQLSHTPFERMNLDVTINFIRAFILEPTAMWSLWDQWVETGAGRQTDDYRTSYVGEESPDVLNTMADYLDAHQGHRNLLYRSVFGFGQGGLSAFLVLYSIDIPHKLPLAICQNAAAVALLVQWNSRAPSMYLLRAFLSWVRCGCNLHLAACGRYYVWEACAVEGWHDIRRPFRALHILAAVRMFLIGLSLILEWRFPKRGVTDTYGCEQLFYRGCIRGFGMPLHLAKAITKATYLVGTEFERAKMEIAVDFLRAIIFTPLQSMSLYEQWMHSGEPAKPEEQIALLECDSSTDSENSETEGNPGE